MRGSGNRLDKTNVYMSTIPGPPAIKTYSEHEYEDEPHILSYSEKPTCSPLITTIRFGRLAKSYTVLFPAAQPGGFDGGLRGFPGVLPQRERQLHCHFGSGSAPGPGMVIAASKVPPESSSSTSGPDAILALLSGRGVVGSKSLSLPSGTGGPLARRGFTQLGSAT